MSNQRLFQLINEVRARPGQTAKALAEKFGCSERAIQRDFAKRLPDLGVRAVNNRGYRFEHDPHLKPLALSSEEIVSLILAEQLAQEHLDDSVRGPLKTAVDKLKRQFCNQDRVTAQKIEERTVVEPGPETEADTSSALLAGLTEAVSRQQEITFAYQGRDDQACEKRHAEPIGLFFQEGRWYLHAFDLNRQGIRTFRLSRMNELVLSAKRFEARAKFDADIASFHEWDIGDRESTEFELEVSAGLARWFHENKPHPTVKVEGTKVTLKVTDPQAFLRWFASLDGAELLTPLRYRSVFQNRLRTLAQSYET